MTATRRLSVTLAPDVIGYSRLMGENGGGRCEERRESRQFLSAISCAKPKWMLYFHNSPDRTRARRPRGEEGEEERMRLCYLRYSVTREKIFLFGFSVTH